MSLNLPPRAQRIFDRIRSEDSDFRAFNVSLARQRSDIKAQKQAALTRLTALEAADQKGRLVKERRSYEGDREIVEQTRDAGVLDAIRDEIAGYDRRLAELNEQQTPERMTAGRIANELAKVKRATFIDVERPALPKKERPGDFLKAVREASDALRAERKEIERRPRTLADAKKAARTQVAALVRVPQVAGLFQGGEIIWPRTEIYIRNDQRPAIVDAAGLLAFVFTDELVKRIDSILDFNASAFANGISESERSKHLAELDTKIAEGERLEAAAVEAVIAEGDKAFHRPHIDILTVLGIATA